MRERQKSRRHRQAEACHTERHIHKDRDTVTQTGRDAQRLRASTNVRRNCGIYLRCQQPARHLCIHVEGS